MRLPGLRAQPPRAPRRGRRRRPAAAGRGQLFGDAFRQVSYGAAPGGNVVVVLSFRGGSDGLSIVVPRSRDHAVLTAQRRPDLVVPLDRLVGGNGSWGLHPALAAAGPDVERRHVRGRPRASACRSPTCSHFDAMEELEEAHPGSTARVGWINRMIGLDDAALPEEQIQIGDADAADGARPAPPRPSGPAASTDFKLPSLWTRPSQTGSTSRMKNDVGPATPPA